MCQCIIRLLSFEHRACMAANIFTLNISGPTRGLASEAKTADPYLINQLVARKRAVEPGHFSSDPVDEKAIQSRLAPDNIASSAILITAQRPTRRLCACSTPDNIRPRGAARAAATGVTSRFAGSRRSRKRSKASSGDNATGIAEQVRREGIRDLCQSGPVLIQMGNGSDRGSHGLHQRVK